MKKIFNLMAVVALIVSASACAVGYPVLATDNSVGDKVGEAKYNIILGFIITDKGDASIKKAAKNGGITKVATVDYVVTSKLFKAEVKTVVTGE